MKVLDLFCGCGGFSLGFEQAGFEVKYAIDIWDKVKETFEFNHPNTEFILADITTLDPNNFKDVDIVIGSPPCQQFSKANNNGDPKEGMKLVNEFLKWIDIIKPKYWIMENVANAQKFLDTTKFLVMKTLNCADYGVPQKRRRCFCGNYIVPIPTHGKNMSIDLGTGTKLEKSVTVREALGVIGTLTDQRSVKNNSCHTPNYDSEQPARVITSVPHKIFIPYSETWLKRHPPINSDEPITSITSKDDKHYFEWRWSEEWFKKQPPIKLDEVSTTIRANFKKGNALGLVETENEKIYRKLTTTECAILQSFPLDFQFFGAYTNQYLMIGNAVPPLMSYHLAKTIMEKMK